MSDSIREMLVGHAVAKGFQGQEIEQLLLEAEDNYRLLGYAIMFQQFIIRLLAK